MPDRKSVPRSLGAAILPPLLKCNASQQSHLPRTELGQDHYQSSSVMMPQWLVPANRTFMAGFAELDPPYVGTPDSWAHRSYWASVIIPRRT